MYWCRPLPGLTQRTDRLLTVYPYPYTLAESCSLARLGGLNES